MGGYGSGRPGHRTAVEDALRLDLASPAVRAAVRPGCWRRGSFTWSRDGEPIGSARYEADATETEARLTLSYSANGVPVRQAIDLIQSRPRFGGFRWWFLCPLLAARGERRIVRALFLPPGARTFGCRAAYGLNHQSQKDSGGMSGQIERLLRDYG